MHIRFGSPRVGPHGRQFLSQPKLGCFYLLFCFYYVPSPALIGHVGHREPLFVFNVVGATCCTRAVTRQCWGPGRWSVLPPRAICCHCNCHYHVLAKGVTVEVDISKPPPLVYLGAAWGWGWVLHGAEWAAPLLPPCSQKHISLVFSSFQDGRSCS
jgi:hypothetical protein